jgi:hypothetical protein
MMGKSISTWKKVGFSLHFNLTAVYSTVLILMILGLTSVLADLFHNKNQ